MKIMGIWARFVRWVTAARKAHGEASTTLVTYEVDHQETHPDSGYNFSGDDHGSFDAEFCAMLDRSQDLAQSEQIELEFGAKTSKRQLDTSGTDLVYDGVTKSLEQQAAALNAIIDAAIQVSSVVSAAGGRGPLPAARTQASSGPTRRAANGTGTTVLSTYFEPEAFRHLVELIGKSPDGGRDEPPLHTLYLTGLDAYPSVGKADMRIIHELLMGFHDGIMENSVEVEHGAAERSPRCASNSAEQLRAAHLRFVRSPLCVAIRRYQIRLAKRLLTETTCSKEVDRRGAKCAQENNPQTKQIFQKYAGLVEDRLNKYREQGLVKEGNLSLSEIIKHFATQMTRDEEVRSAFRETQNSADIPTVEWCETVLSDLAEQRVLQVYVRRADAELRKIARLASSRIVDWGVETLLETLAKNLVLTTPPPEGYVAHEKPAGNLVEGDVGELFAKVKAALEAKLLSISNERTSELLESAEDFGVSGEPLPSDREVDEVIPIPEVKTPEHPRSWVEFLDRVTASLGVVPAGQGGAAEQEQQLLSETGDVVGQFGVLEWAEYTRELVQRSAVKPSCMLRLCDSAGTVVGQAADGSEEKSSGTISPRTAKMGELTSVEKLLRTLILQYMNTMVFKFLQERTRVIRKYIADRTQSLALVDVEIHMPGTLWQFPIPLKSGALGNLAKGKLHSDARRRGRGATSTTSISVGAADKKSPNMSLMDNVVVEDKNAAHNTFTRGVGRLEDIPTEFRGHFMSDTLREQLEGLNKTKGELELVEQFLVATLALVFRDPEGVHPKGSMETAVESRVLGNVLMSHWPAMWVHFTKPESGAVDEDFFTEFSEEERVEERKIVKMAAERWSLGTKRLAERDPERARRGREAMRDLSSKWAAHLGGGARRREEVLGALEQGAEIADVMLGKQFGDQSRRRTSDSYMQIFHRDFWLLLSVRCAAARSPGGGKFVIV